MLEVFLTRWKSEETHGIPAYKEDVKCNVCGQMFLSNYDHTIHIVDHNINKPFLCDQCKHGFSNPRDLSRHIMTHTGERPFACNVCQKTFTLDSNLKKHLLSQHYSSKGGKNQPLIRKYTEGPHQWLSIAQISNHKRGRRRIIVKSLFVEFVQKHPIKPLMTILRRGAMMCFLVHISEFLQLRNWR